MEREMDRRIGAASAVMRALYRSVVVKKVLRLRKNEITDTSGRNEFPPESGWAQP